MSLVYTARNEALSRTESSLVSPNHSACCWWLESSAIWGAVLTIYDSVTTGDLCRLWTNDNTVLFTTANADHTLSGLNTYGKWNFFGWTVSGNTHTTYSTHTGSWVKAAFTDTGHPTAYNQITIGDSAPAGAQPWLGNVQNVKIWSGAALTEQEMKCEMASSMPFRTNGLKVWYPLLTITDAIYDYSGHGKTLTEQTLKPSSGSGAPVGWR